MLTGKKKNPPTPEAMRLRMADLCARSEQCLHDIRRKLAASRISPEASEEIIAYLVENSFIDESRFARAFTADKVRFQGWGRMRIRRELSMRRIPERDIAAAIDGLDEEEYAASLRRVAEAKARGLDLAVREDAMRLYRHLLSRGYTSEESVREIRRLRNGGRQS